MFEDNVLRTLVITVEECAVQGPRAFAEDSAICLGSRTEQFTSHFDTDLPDKSGLAQDIGLPTTIDVEIVRLGVDWAAFRTHLSILVGDSKM